MLNEIPGVRGSTFTVKGQPGRRVEVCVREHWKAHGRRVETCYTLPRRSLEDFLQSCWPYERDDRCRCTARDVMDFLGER